MTKHVKAPYNFAKEKEVENNTLSGKTMRSFCWGPEGCTLVEFLSIEEASVLLVVFGRSTSSIVHCETNV